MYYARRDFEALAVRSSAHSAAWRGCGDSAEEASAQFSILNPFSLRCKLNCIGSCPRTSTHLRTHPQRTCTYTRTFRDDRGGA